MGYSSKVNQTVLPLGPLFAAEQRRPARGFGRALGEPRVPMDFRSDFPPDVLGIA